MNGFLAPDGTFYGCLYEGHSELARILIEKYETPRTNPETHHLFYDDESLKFSNFIYFGCGYIDSYVFVDNNAKFKPTEEQRKWVLENEDYITERQMEEIKWLFDGVVYW